MSRTLGGYRVLVELRIVRDGAVGHEGPDGHMCRSTP